MSTAAKTSSRSRYGTVFRQFIKFGLVGGTGVLVNTAVAIAARKAVFEANCPDAEVAVLSGGQPVYYYIISME